MTLPIGWIPFVGDALEQLNLMIWLGLIAVAALSLFLFRTPRGLRMRSVGENPLAADTAGISPINVRYYAVIASGALAALGGVFLSIGFVHSFSAEHDDRQGLHRPGRGHLRQVEARRRARRGAAVRLLQRARAAAAGVLADHRDAASRRCRTCSR